MNMEINEHEFEKYELYNLGSIMGDFIQMIKKCIKEGKYTEAEKACDSALNCRDKIIEKNRPNIYAARTMLHNLAKK